VKDRELNPELVRIADLLDRVGREERATLAAADALTSRESGLPGAGRVKILEELPLPPRGRVLRGRWPWFVSGLAIAAGLLLALRVLQPAAEVAEQPRDTFLAGEELQLVPPASSGNQGVWERLEWTFPPTEGIVFDVRVLDLDEQLLLRERVRETRLTLEADRTTTWPPTLIVEIDALDGGGRSVGSLQELVSLP